MFGRKKKEVLKEEAQSPFSPLPPPTKEQKVQKALKIHKEKVEAFSLEILKSLIMSKASLDPRYSNLEDMSVRMAVQLIKSIEEEATRKERSLLLIEKSK